MFEDAMRRFDIDLNKMSFENLNRKDIEKVDVFNLSLSMVVKIMFC